MPSDTLQRRRKRARLLLNLPCIRARLEANHLVLPALAAAAWLAAVLMAPTRDVRSQLPFALLPGVAYLALMAGPFLLRGGGERVQDLQFAAYGGPAYTMPSRLALEQPGGTNLTLDEIAWEGKPFKALPYYGYRGIYWLPRSGFGILGDHPSQNEGNKGAERQTSRHTGRNVRSRATAARRHLRQARIHPRL